MLVGMLAVYCVRIRKYQRFHSLVGWDTCSLEANLILVQKLTTEVFIPLIHELKFDRTS